MCLFILFFIQRPISFTLSRIRSCIWPCTHFKACILIIYMSRLMGVSDFCIASLRCFFDIEHASNPLNKITYLFNFRGIMFDIRSSSSIEIIHCSLVWFILFSALLFTKCFICSGTHFKASISIDKL
jgi:hypothetical protein